MKFQNYAVVYMDILGFSKFVEDAENCQDKLDALGRLFNDVIPREITAEGRNSEYPADLCLKCLSCSDSLIVSAPIFDNCSYPALIAVSIKAIQIAHALLDMGFLVRGALAVGNVYRTESNILGTGYQEAVNGERAAHYPQIVLADSAKQGLDRLISDPNCPRYAIFAKNELGQVVLDSIYPHETYLPTTSMSVGEYYGRYRNTIVQNLSHEDLRVREKWLWFAGFFNANVRYFGSMIGSDIQEIDQELPSITMNYLNPPANNFSWMTPFQAPGATVRIVNPNQPEEP